MLFKCNKPLHNSSNNAANKKVSGMPISTLSPQEMRVFCHAGKELNHVRNEASGAFGGGSEGLGDGGGRRGGGSGGVRSFLREVEPGLVPTPSACSPAIVCACPTTDVCVDWKTCACAASWSAAEGVRAPWMSSIC